jgi:hypothetical protein
MTSLLFKQTTARELGILRAVVFSIWFVIIIFTPFHKYYLLPIDIFEPLGIYRLIFQGPDHFITQFILSKTFLLFLKTLLPLCILLCILGIRPFNVIAIPTVLCLFLIDGMVKGFTGFVNHAELGGLYIALILSLSKSADGFSIHNTKSYKNQTNDCSIPILLSAFTLCMAYSFVGVHRFIHGGLEQFYNETINIYLITNSLNYSKFTFTLGLYITESKILLSLIKSGFFLVTILEMLSPFILISKYFRYFWLSVMIPFHLLSLITMNILFWENLILITLLFIFLPYIKKKNTHNCLSS